MHYVGQQHRERQGWGKKDEAEQCVRLHVSMHECVHTSAFARFCRSAVGARTTRGLHPAVQMPEIRCQKSPPEATSDSQKNDELLSALRAVQ